MDLLLSFILSLISALVAALAAYCLVERKNKKTLNNYYHLYRYELESLNSNYSTWLLNLLEEFRNPRTLISTVPIDIDIEYISKLQIHLLTRINTSHRKLLK